MRNFNFLARHYNAMTGFPGRIATLADSIRPWVEEWRVTTALDAGCGGGALMFALADLRVAPTGLDLSEPMLRLAMDNARQRGRTFVFHGAPHSSAGRICPDTFDAVFCLGNSIIGEPDDAAMIESLAGLNAALRPGGHILIQNLNLTPFLLGIKALIARRSVDGCGYLRFAVPVGGRLLFSALVLPSGDESPDIQSAIWENWDKDRVLACVWKAGFKHVECYGSLDKKPFDLRHSTDLVISAQRPV
ncbi:MAG: class I SAM-dependent methyltransferase [candidate division Zixibacteria bacterium]|nr:class I SAM-dependent methyltransferase [candidate division Zixibacteria bacterium]